MQQDTNTLEDDKKKKKKQVFTFFVICQGKDGKSHFSYVIRVWLMHLRAVYDFLHKSYNNVTPIFCYDGSAEHSLVYLYCVKCEDKAAFAGLQ